MENASERTTQHTSGASEHVRSHESEHTPPHTPRTPESTGAPYTAHQITQRYADIGVKEVTVRTRWFKWLLKVAPDPLLKDGQGFTELAAELFDDFAQKVKRDGMKSEDWVQDAKARYAQEWGSVGVIEGELMPEEVGGALALLQTQGSSLQHQLQAELGDLQTFIDQVHAVEDDFTEAELQMFRAKGAMRGVKRFRVETQSELEIYSALRQQQTQQTGEQQ